MIDNFKQAFQEEAREILVELEATLLELGESPADSELVSRAFRALHTIKGSGSMFGFDELAAFTHNLENAFDEVRNGRLTVTSDLINLSLAALDQIKVMIEEGGTGGTTNAVASTEILAKLRELTGSLHVKEQPAPKIAAAPTIVAHTLVPSPVGATGAVCDWVIHFAPGPDLLRNGASPLTLIRDLQQLGRLRIMANVASIPPLGELDPHRCYVSWDIILTTSAGRDGIRDVFIFVEDNCELTIEPASDHASDRPSLAESPAPKTVDEKRSNFGRRATDAPDAASNIRVPAAKLDQFVDLVGELVTVQARLGDKDRKSVV